MSLPAAVLPDPIAVLVLAWDEATPAVRALVEATHAPAPIVDSILVMVPQADAPAHLSAEEYLPLPAGTYAAAEDLATAEAPQETEVLEEPAAPPLASIEPVKADAIATTSTLAEPNTEPAPSPALETLPKEITAPTWAAVRVLRIASHSLPQLAQRAGQPFPAPIWTDPAHTPAAPYLGATPLAPAPPAASPTPALAAPSTEAQPSEQELANVLAPNATAAQPAAVAAAEPVAALASVATISTPAAPLYEPAEALPQGTLETDLPLAKDEANQLEEAPSRDLFQEADFSPSLAQAGWPEALASLRQPATLATPSFAEATPSSLPPANEPAPGLSSEPASPASGALQPAATHYPAPDLNYQVIQYARFAVPVALAEAEFAVIYAPAWPTWLAAQELRQRTGRPLVLHVATLAASAAESVATATGWMADLQRQAMQRADLILTETPALAERLRRELGLPFATVQAAAAADAPAIAHALHSAQPRLVA